MTCWLLESMTQPPLWLGECNCELRWTSAVDAIRFARRDDAEAAKRIIEKRFGATPMLMMRVTEHGFDEERRR